MDSYRHFSEVSTVTVQFRIRVQIEQGDAFTESFDGPVTFGRQSSPNDVYLTKTGDKNGWRIAIATPAETTISRDHVLIEPVGPDRICITNVSTKNYFYLEESAKVEIAPRAKVTRILPVKLSFGKVRLHILGAHSESGEVFETVQAEELEPRHVANELAAALVHASSLDATPSGPSRMGLRQWLPALRLLLERAPTRDEFFKQALSTVLEFVDLDWTAVLLSQPVNQPMPQSINETVRTKNDPWVQVASRHGRSERLIAPEFFASRKILENVLVTKSALIRNSAEMEFDSSQSLRGIESIVAAPIIDEQGAVLGALYGQRIGEIDSRSRPRLSELEKDLVRTIAAGVGLGLMWQTQAHAATAAEVRFSQFFGPQLAATLRAQPQLMEGKQAEVTVLFCDIRGFSAISHQLHDPARTMEWTSNVMEELSACVLKYEGVLVDYMGDELFAMWGAPLSQPDHAQRACEAALEMRGLLPLLNERWKPILGRDFDFGIGLNSGSAFVGNMGTQMKMKYGPLGPHVNLASRVQGATKYLRTDLLITQNTRKLLPASLPTRRVCAVRVINIPEPVELYEVRLASDEGWMLMRTEYEAALVEFEAQHFHRAVRILGNILAEHPTDGASLALLSRVTKQLVHADEPFDPVWELPGK